MTFDLAECRRRNQNAIRNTATGKWLGLACEEIERLVRERDALGRLLLSSAIVDFRKPTDKEIEWGKALADAARECLSREA